MSLDPARDLQASREHINKLTQELLQLETPGPEAVRLAEQIGREVERVRSLQSARG